MNLDYQEIMDMREPRGSVDVETMGEICRVYGKLVAKFSRLLGEAKQITTWWMREERTAFYAKRLAAFEHFIKS